MPTPSGSSRGSHPRDRRTRWKAAPAPAAGSRSRLPARLAWTAASIALLAAVALLVIPPLFMWHAAVVQLTIDEYDLGMLAALPFGGRDTDAVATAVAGRLTPALNRAALRLERSDTAAALREQLRPRIAALPLRPRDVLVAVVRAQAGIAGAADGTPFAGVFASDAQPAEPLPDELVPCRDLFAAFASAPARTTLIAIDFGDVRWDPRLAAVGGIVPALLDEECRRPLEPAPAPGPRERDCWVLGSHDTLEFSAVNLAARRSLFSRALELGLAGAADDPRWAAAGGDGDGIVELDELARFTAAWTSRWARQESDGDWDQRPVLWKCGTGRVPLDKVPPGIAIIRTNNRQLPMPTVAIAGNDPEATGGAAAAADPTPADPAAPGTVDPRSAAPAAPGEPAQAAAALPAAQPSPAETDVRGIIARLATASDSDPSPLDSIPHLWRDVDALSAAVSATVRDGSPLAERAALLDRRLGIGLDRFVAGAASAGDGAAEVTKQLVAASRAVTAAGFAAAWRSAPPPVRTALAARNRAVELAWSTTAWIGQMSGGTRASTHLRGLNLVLERVAVLNAEFGRLADRRTDGDDDFAALDRHRVAMESAVGDLTAAVEGAVDELLERSSRPGPRPVAELRWLAASRLPTPPQCARIAAALAPPQPPTAAAPAADTVGSQNVDKKTAPAEQALALKDPAPPVPVDRLIDRLAWRHLADHADAVRLLLRSFGPLSQRFDSLVADVGTAITDLTTAADAPAQAAAAAGRLGLRMAAALAAVPAEIDAVARSRPGATIDPQRTVDAFVRLVDPRDAARIRPDARGWAPAVRPQAALAVNLTARELRLDPDRPQRVTLALASAAAFPAAATLRLDFDPARIRVTAVGGDAIAPGARFAPATLGMRDRGLFDVTAASRGAAAANGEPETATLTCILEAGGRRERGALTFELPVIEQIAVAVRGAAGTVEKGVPDAWLTLPLDPLASVEESGAGANRAPCLTLRPFPGHTTGWELSLVNRTNRARRVSIELISIEPSPGENGQPGSAGDELWSRCREAVANRRRLPPGARVVATCAALDLPASERHVLASLQPTPAPAAPDGAAPPAGAAQEAGASLAAHLAVVVRDVVAVAGAEAATAGSAPALQPPATPLAWACRVDLLPQHPRRYVDTAARWTADDRSITVAVRPRGGDARLLPPFGARAQAAPLAARVARDQPLALRKLQALVTPARPADELRAVWNGVDEASAWLAVDIDGHPRARVFRVECGPAASGTEQRPQDDWRHVDVLSPDRDDAAFRAPAAVIPLVLAADGPPDAFGPGGGKIEVTVRQEGTLAGGLPDPGRLVWSATTDRQASYALEAAEPPVALAIRTTVSDWNVSLADIGFQDVDVIVEARLILPGEAAARTARRRLVLDGSPPRVTPPPRAVIHKGREAEIVVEPEDGPAFNALVGGRRAGSSGIERVEWGIDTKGNAAPEKWEVAAGLGGSRFRIGVPTESLALGRHRLLVRAFDRVGFESRAATCDLEVIPPPPPAAEPEKPKPETRNAIHGRVTLDGQPHGGITVTIEGPGAPGPTTSGPDGSFSFTGLDPGEYRLSVRETTVRNRLYSGGPVSASVTPPPAQPTVVELPLK